MNHTLCYVADFDLTASISLASVLSPMSCNTSVSVSQLTGSLPLPLTHSWRISLLIRSASCLCLSSMFRTLVPFGSSRRRRPKSWYFVLIFSAILIFPSLPWNLMHFSKVGQSAVTMKDHFQRMQVRSGRFRPTDLQGKTEEKDLATFFISKRFFQFNLNFSGCYIPNQ